MDLNDTLGSDHSPTVTYINIQRSEETDDSERFILSKADWESFKNNTRILLSPDLISESSSVNVNFDILTSAILDAAELSITQCKKGKATRLKPLPYWKEDCKLAIRDRNKARNIMHKNKTSRSCINYRRLKGKAQHVIKSTALEHWESYCSTLDRSTKLGSVWTMEDGKENEWVS